MWPSPVGGLSGVSSVGTGPEHPGEGLRRGKGSLGEALGNSRISSFGELGEDSTGDRGGETSGGSGFLPRLAHSIRGLSYSLIWSWSFSLTFFVYTVTHAILDLQRLLGGP